MSVFTEYLRRCGYGSMLFNASIVEKNFRGDYMGCWFELCWTIVVQRFATRATALCVCVVFMQYEWRVGERSVKCVRYVAVALERN